MIYTNEDINILKDHLLSLISIGKKLTVSDCYIQSVNKEFDYNTCISLYHQICLRLYTSNNYIPSQLIQRILSGESLIQLAYSYKVSSYKLSKLVLESYSNNKSVTISMFLDNPNIITDKQLRNGIINGITNDLLCSYSQDQVKELIGKQYERLLIKLLNKYQLIYETESDLRNKGKPKTPDILLLIPMITSFNINNNIVTNVINWIDSKAMFADEITFDEHKEQFDSYTSRYGRGLVIYWFGFNENVLNKVLNNNNDMIIVIDHFPSNWRYPTGDYADGNIPTFLSSNLENDR